MPRKENPIDPDAGPLATFAHELRALRRAAGNPTYRALSRRAGYSVTTLSVAASGTRLPALDVTLAYVQACGGDPEHWRDRWYQVAARLAAEGRDDLIADQVPEPRAYAVTEPRIVQVRPRRRNWLLLIGVPLVLLIALLFVLLMPVGSHQQGATGADGAPPPPPAQTLTQGR